MVRGRATKLGNQQSEVDQYGTFTGAGDAAATRCKKKGHEKRKIKISEETRVLVDALWKFSTESQIGDPHVVQRKCGRCGSGVTDDEQPCWFDMRVQTDSSSYELRRVYFMKTVLPGSLWRAYLCKSCISAKHASSFKTQLVAFDFPPVHGTLLRFSAQLVGTELRNRRT